MIGIAAFALTQTIAGDRGVITLNRATAREWAGTNALVTLSGSTTNVVVKWDLVPGATYDVMVTPVKDTPETAVHAYMFQSSQEPEVRFTIPRSRAIVHRVWVRSVYRNEHSAWVPGPRLFYP